MERETGNGVKRGEKAEQRCSEELVTTGIGNTLFISTTTTV
jgi:hypothetical protein